MSQAEIQLDMVELLRSPALDTLQSYIQTLLLPLILAASFSFSKQ